MDEAHLDFLIRRVKPQFYIPGEQILSPVNGMAEHLYIIELGEVERHIGNSDPKRKRENIRDGEMFPISALLTDRPPHLTYIAKSDTLALQLHIDHFHQLRQMSPVFEDYCIHRIAGMLQQEFDQATQH